MGIKTRDSVGCSCCITTCPSLYTWDFASDPLNYVGTGYTPDFTQRYWYVISGGTDTGDWNWRSAELYADTFGNQFIPHAYVLIPTGTTAFSVQADMTWNAGFTPQLNLQYGRSLSLAEVAPLVYNWYKGAGPTTVGASGPATTLIASGSGNSSGTLRMEFAKSGGTWGVTYKLSGSTLGSDSGLTLSDLDDAITNGECLAIHVAVFIFFEHGGEEITVDNVVWDAV